MATDEIRTVLRVSKDGGDYVIRCKHCHEIIGIEGDDLSEIRGEQYRCRCGGWNEVHFQASFVRELPEHGRVSEHGQGNAGVRMTDGGQHG